MKHWQSFTVSVTVALLLALSVWLLMQPLPAHAGTITVTNTQDAGSGSLRQAIADASPGNTINFASGLAGQTIALSSMLTLNKDVTIDGTGLTSPITLDGRNAVGVFKVANNARVTLAALTIVRGKNASDCSGYSCGGGLKIEIGASVTLTHSAVFSSTATFGGGIYNSGMLMVINSTLSGNSATVGGGIANYYGTLTVQSSTLSDNSANSYGGGIFNSSETLTVQNSTLSGNSAAVGGGISNYSTLTVQNSTFSGNSANPYGGGIFNDSGTLTVQNSTLSGNGATVGGGIYNSGTLNYANTIIANSTAGGDCYNESTIVTNTHNLVESGSCSAALSGDPLLGPLADNGGPSTSSGQATWTHALLTGSPAIDAVPVISCTMSTDQRGVARPQGVACDIGAYEAPPQPILTLVKSVTPPNSAAYHGVITYTVVLSNTGALSDTNIILTDTLPAQVGFEQWLEQPAGVIRDGDAITWTGTLTDSTVITFTFAVTYTVSSTEMITNTARFSGTLQTGSADAMFNAACGNAITVQNANDSGAGSLRQAIAGVCAGGVITFANGLNGQTIALSSTLTLDKDMTIDGSTLPISITLDGQDAVRVFRVITNTRVTLAALAIVRGKDTSTECSGGSCGGGLKIESGASVTLTHSAILSSTADYGGYGGGIYNRGALTVTNSTLAGNSALFGSGIYNDYGTLTVQNSTLSGSSAYAGGGIYNDSGTLTVQDSTFSGSVTSIGGGIYNDSGTLTVQNSTLSNNRARDSGGGISNSGALTLTNSTLSGNSAGYYGGGIYNSGTLNYANTIIANSTAGGDCYNDSGGTIVSNTHNLAQDGSCSAALSGDPLLGPLADNGGGTWTHALLPGSPAIDAVPVVSCAVFTDQRGVTRPQGPACDIGAYELGMSIAKSVTPTSNAPYHGVVTYTLVLSNRGAVSDTNVILTDTLPAQTRFGQWLEQPAGVIRNGDAITWTGTLTSSAAITFTFTATQTGGYGDMIANTARFSGTLQKGSDDAPFSVVCASSAITAQNANDSGAGSLRQAITEVCAGGVITFANGLSGQTIALSSALTLNKDLTIDGSALPISITLDGQNAVRVFKVANNARVTLKALTIARGKGTSDCLGDSCGGGLKIESGASVTLTHSAILSSTAFNGGCIYNSGTLTVQNSAFSGNSADGGCTYNSGALTVQNSTFSGNSGGGIFNSGTLTVQNSTLSGNSGRGIRNDETLTVQNSTLSGNSGGGISNGGTLTVQDSTLSGNSAGSGGGISNEGTLTLTNSTLSGNSAGYGGGIRNDGTLTVQNSTLSGNSVAYASGGGILNSGTLTVQNSTLSGNSSTNGNFWNGGGAIDQQGSSSSSTIINSTIVNNTAAGFNQAKSGIWLEAGALTLRNSIVAQNNGANNFKKDSGTFTSQGYNLSNAWNGLPTQSTDLTGDPLLGPLADNGGDILTHALLPGSPAIDAVPIANCAVSTDQRGVARPQGVACDIGAYEAPQPTLALAKSVMPTSNAPYHGVVTYTVVLSNTGAVSDTNVILTDTLPAQTSFGQWIGQPAGAIREGDTITWTGTLTNSTALTFTFTATHTSDYGDAITNTARFSGTLQTGSDDATFSVESCNAITVRNTNDSGIGSLRQAIAGVCAGGVITFDSGLSGQTIALSSTLTLNKDMTINGTGLTSPITLDGQNAVRVFQVITNTRVTLAALTIVRGKDTSTECFSGSCGGGIKIESGASVTLTHSAILSSTAIVGGGISNSGALTVQNSTLSGNSATGIDSWGGGGAIDQWGGGSSSTIINSTIVSNTAVITNQARSGIWLEAGTLTLRNSIVAQNNGDNNFKKDSGTFTSQGYNLADAWNGLSIQPTDLTNDPRLGPLADNGGPSTGSGWTHALLPGSPAIDAVPVISCIVSTDQRGKPRDDLGCDIGAYELRYADSPTVIRPVSSAVTTTFGPALTGIQRDPAATDPGVITVTKSLTWKTTPTNTIAAYWYITPTMASGFNLTLTLCYTSAESNGFNLNTLRFWRFSAGQWNAVTGTPVVTSTAGINQCATITGVTALSAWTLGGASQPTAVVLRRFGAQTSEVWWPVALLALGAAALTSVLSRKTRERR